MRFHFALGPVQSFVAQARRTRDLWAGSFLISYLVANGIQAVLQQGGQMIFPAVTDTDGGVDDPLIARLTGTQDISDTLATVPNRFVAEVLDDFDPLNCARAIETAWARIEHAVWDAYVEPIESLGHETREIWRRQVNGFWEISWALAEAEEMDVMDRRKNWRTGVGPSEGGIKCTMMPQFQEISGHYVSTLRGEFWRALSVTLPPRELREGEELSAVALIKRLFPGVAESAIGWAVPTHYPSTVDLAAQPWLGRQEKKNAPWFRMLQTYLRSDDVASKLILGSGQIDASLWYESSRTNDRLWPQDSSAVRRQVGEVLKAAESLPTPYYAVLLMDGDKLGELLRKNDPGEVSRALKSFTQNVKPLLEADGGTLIYAGGDDVLALLPNNRVLEAALSLRDRYRQALVDCGGTISAAIVYVHMHAPLTSVLREAHRLLDQVAKDQNGRNSAVFARWASQGPTTLFVSTWERLGTELGFSLRTLADEVRTVVSTRFLSKIQELEARLGDARFISREEWVDILHEEMERSTLERAETSPQDLLTVMNALLCLAGGASLPKERNGRLELTGAARLLRFLLGYEEELA